jgi:hypothetical protein
MKPSMTENISADSASETQNDLAIAYEAKRNRDRRAQQARRDRRRAGVVTRRMQFEHEWLDALEERGYLNPFDRTIALAEVDAMRKFLDDQLKPRAK